ncbi:tetratricopeptide repeat protein [Actinoplanes sp. NPDC051861]|uniref:tetratricopeptide repeat protein n=1 Tax=Actinoplanes sp. NPDC051861 TaxID=3155170 RepID=UPI0034488E45
MTEYEAEISGSRNVQVGSHNTLNAFDVDADTLPPPQRTGDGTVPHNLPPASSVFEGRDVADLFQLLGGTETGVVVGQAAVHGLGGIGKSELANQYARSYLNRYRLIWWITAENKQAVGLGLAALTKRLHPVAKLAEAQEWAVGWLQSNTGWLLVLDNVEDIDDIAELLGAVSGRGQILITTRRNLGSRWRSLGLRTMQLEVLERPASVRLLRELTGLDDSDGAERLAQHLGDLPLGLQQAAAYISQHHAMTFDEYTALLTEEFARAASDAGEGGTRSRTLAAVWTVTMSAVMEKSPLAAGVLEVMAWLGADPLPEAVLNPLADDHRDVADALAVLTSYSMISRRPSGVAMHRLVQAVTRSQATEDDSRESAMKLLVAAAPPDPASNVEGFAMWAALLPHVAALTDHMSPGDHSATMLFLRDRTAVYQQYQGNFDTAVAIFESALAYSEPELGPENAGTLTTRANLANAYSFAGRIADAVGLLEQVVRESERIRGVDDPETLIARANLADCYRLAGRADESISMQERAVHDFVRVLGSEHRHVLTVRSHLANSYLQVRRVDDAIALLKQIISDCERILGPEHLHTFTARANLATSYSMTGRFTDAIPMHEQVLTYRMRILGSEHPDTISTRANLAAAYWRSGQADDAIALLEEVAAVRKRIHGSEHPLTVAVVRTLAQWRQNKAQS